MKESFDKKKRSKFFSIAIVLVIVIFLVLLLKGENRPLEGFFYRVSQPFAKFFSAAGYWTRDRISFFGSIGEIKTENEELMVENLALKSQLAELQDVKNENEELRKQIELAPRGEYELRSAVVIGKDISGKSEVIHIDKGTREGIEEKMAVVVGEGVIIGKVIKVHPTSAEVELILDRNSKVNAEIVQSGVKGIVEGQFGTSAAMTMIPQTVEVHKGDTVITSGVGNILPRGLLVGYVQDVASASDQLFQRATLVFPASFDNLRIVWVVKSSK